MTLVVSGGTVVTATGSFLADVVCEGEHVSTLTETETRQASDERVDARGMLVFPGFIDPHVHSRDPGATHKEDFAHSTLGALCGGVTTILEMPNSVPPVTTAASLEQRADALGRTAWVDFGLWGLSVGAGNLGDLPGMVAAGAVGVKLFWGYALRRDTLELVYNLTDDDHDALVMPPHNGEVLDIFRTMAASGAVFAAHCEDRGVLESAAAGLGHPVTTYDDLLASRPAIAESASISLGAEFAASTGCRFHVVHLGSALGAHAVRAAQARGISITAETCPHYLTLTDADHATIGSAMKCYPPIRGTGDRDELWRAVADGTVSSIGSDHAPHTLEEKQRPLSTQPAGGCGIETMVPLLVDQMVRGRLSPERLADVMATSTAKLYGLWPRKGAIEPGADADLVIVDPNGSTTVDNSRLHAKNPLSPWNGRTLQGSVVASVLRGTVAQRNGEPVGDRRGRFVRARVTR